MKKKNLIILLLLPFLIALLIVQIGSRNLGPKIPRDITGIEWNYKDRVPFHLTDTVNGNLFKLEAKGVVPKGYTIDVGNNLIWSVKNKDINDETEYAKIEQNAEGEFFLRVLKEGNVTVTCTNEKGNISKQMTACIYEKGLIMINPVIGDSQNNIDSTIYYGNQDIKDNKLVSASIDLNIETIPETLLKDLMVTDITSNIEFNLSKQKISIKPSNSGYANLTLKVRNNDEILPSSFTFEIINDGVNVYTYQDLLFCTNDSEKGEIVVLRKSFESVENAFKQDINGNIVIKNGKPEPKSNNVECFGTYNHKEKGTINEFNFAKEVFSFKTEFNDTYITQWNNFVEQNGTKFKKIDNHVFVGLHVQKDFYGNGYTINMHNLTFPHEIFEDTGEISFRGDELFLGPLPFYVLGDPNGSFLVKALGQDNIGMYVHGNNITVNDVDMKNCDYGSYVSNLDTTGTVIDIFGDNNTIKNSRFSSGKNVMRSFSSNNLVVINCALSYSRNFLFISGANEYIPISGIDEKTFYNLDATTFESTIDLYLKADGESLGDKILNEFILQDVPPTNRESVRRIILAIQDALNNKNLVENRYKGSTEIIDCMFYQSGICPIAAETLFNGPFLYNGSPSSLTQGIPSLPSNLKDIIAQFIPYLPSKVSGISYPIKINISGDTRFYDYKVVKDIDLSGIIDENLSEYANLVGEMFGMNDIMLSIDDIFPLKQYLVDVANSNKYNYYDAITGKSMANIPIAYYGGGANLSTITFDELKTYDRMQKPVEVGFLDRNLLFSTGSNNAISIVKHLMVKTVPVVTGYEPFKFNFYLGRGYLLGKAPNKDDLITNAKKYKGE